MTQLLNVHKVKTNDSKEREILELLKKPGVEEKIAGLAATLSDSFDKQTRLLVDIRPGATILDNHTKMQYIYEECVPSFDFDALTTVILRKAQYPLAELDDQGYMIVRVKGLNNTKYMLAMADFVKMFSIKRWQVVDLNISDEQEITKNMF